MARRKKQKGTLKKQSDPTRWAHLIFALGGFMGFWVLSHAIEDIWAIIWSYWPQISRPDTTTADIAAVVIALGGTGYALAFWGGDFYLFLDAAVWTVDPEGGALEQVLERREGQRRLALAVVVAA